MDDAHRSVTAERAATLRALHQLVDDPRVLDDPVVLRLLPEATIAALRADPSGLQAPGPRALRAFIAARSRFAEDMLAEAVGRGVRQYVVLGAGLDTFAYRSPFPVERLQIFEVDHPSTQAWKRERLAAAGVALPPNLEFVAADFERVSLPQVMAASGLDPHRPACVSWLGVTVYLTIDVVRGVLAWAAALPARSCLVFEYAVPHASSPAGERLRAGMMERSAAAGEPWITFFEPQEMARELAAFAAVVDLGPDEVTARYFAGRRDGLRPRGTARLVCATT